MLQIKKLEDDLKETRSNLVYHPLYQALNTKEKLITFMEDHVFAVWDFMSLIKSLQRNLTCINVPWTPNSNNFSGKLVNEIVLAEESDVDLNNNPKSHFELYLESMQLIGANTSLIDSFVREVNNSQSYLKSVKKIELPIAVKEFMDFTFEIIKTNKNHVIASVFTFGREDLIPDMFIQIVKKLSSEKNIKANLLIHYLERHIELDADEHGPMALKMVQDLCGNEPLKWEEATLASQKALKMRIKLWDSILEKIS
tara:strand:+ start:1602 stop:2366 length:765 start_codon:yes stop_codon:yes gene_type:complete